MKGTYKAVEVSAPGVLRVVERPIPSRNRAGSDSGGSVRNLSHDASTVTGTYPA